MTRQSFLKGAFILMIAGFITKILGFINRIVMARILGEEGVGIYMMVDPYIYSSNYINTNRSSCRNRKICSRSRSCE